MPEQKEQKITIAWDVDDVLNNLTREWFSEYKKEHKTGLEFADLKANPPHDILNISREEYLASLDSFRTRHFMDLSPRKELLLWFEAHGYKFRHIALTATPFKFAELSAGWLMRHFGKWIRSFNFMPSPRPGISYPGYDDNKGSFLAWLRNVDIFIDDNEANIMSAEAFGIRTALFPAPWNKYRNNNEKDFIQSGLIDKIRGEKDD